MRDPRHSASIFRLLATIGFLSTAGLHSAQVRAQAVIPPGAMVIDGYPVACGPAPTYLQGPEVGDVARAAPDGIHIFWAKFNSYPTGVKAFIYAHECGHIFYGPNENTADEFAVKLGRNQGWINPAIIQQMCQAVIMSPGDWSHLPGPARCAMLIVYYNTP